MESSTGVVEGAAVPGVVPQRLRPPRQRGTSLPRRELLARLDDAVTPLVSVRGGAGYGKTTLLRQWCESRPGAVGWVSLDPTDDDPVVLLRHVAAALSDCGVEVDAVVAALSRREARISRSVLPALAAALERARTPFVLVLDDLHEVGGRESLAALEELLDMVPAGSTFVISARWFPPLRLARRLVEGTLTQLDQDDLAFSVDEALSVLGAALPALADRQLRDLVDELDGWPAGTQLAVLALRDRPEAPSVVRGLVAADRRVADYLHQEVLDGLDPAVREFLVGASVLARLTPASCDAVLERADSAEVLDRIARSGNLFVHGSDVADEHRVHELFRELLLAELRRRDPSAESRLRRRAAWWHHEHGDPDGAVVQAVASGDPAFAADMLQRQLFDVMMSGTMGTLGRWIALFPPHQVGADGVVALCAGWHALASGRIHDLEHHLATASAATVEGRLADGTESFDVALSALEMVAGLGGTAATARHAAVVLAAGPDGSPWFGLAAFHAAIADGHLGRCDLIEALSSAEVATRGMPAVHVVCQAQLGHAHLRAGRRVEGLRWVDLAARELADARLEEFSLADVVHGVVSQAAALERDLDRSAAAAAMAETSLRTMEHLVPRGRLHTRLLLADAAIRRGEVAEARRHLDRCGDLLVVERQTVVLQDYAEEIRRALDREQSAIGVVDLTAAERRVLEQLPTHRSLVEIGEHLYVSRNTVKTHTLSIYRKLGVSGRSDAVARALELGLVADPPG